MFLGAKWMSGPGFAGPISKETPCLAGPGLLALDEIQVQTEHFSLNQFRLEFELIAN